MTKLSRGEQRFLHLPRLGAKLYNLLISIKSITRQTEEIARYLSQMKDSGKILDIGTGPGKLLKELHDINPNLKLYGLDISKAMISQAKSNLE